MEQAKNMSNMAIRSALLIVLLCVSAEARSAALRIVTASLPSGQANVAYSASLSASGGRSPYRWSATGLPAGIAVSGPSLAGTPTVAGSFSVALTVRDKTGRTASSTLPLVIAAPPPPPPPPPPANTTSDDEFIGPFASWVNLKVEYGAKGDGVTDDTAAFQAALNDLGTVGHNHSLFVPAGTYKVTQGLSLVHREGTCVIGEDPATTTLKWMGSTTGPLLFLDGDDYTCVNRLTFDGNGAAGLVLVDDRSLTAGGFFDTGNQYVDDVFQNADVGIRCGFQVNGCSEMSVLRDHFSNIASACVITGNYNALDIWVRFSVFDHCGTAIGDTALMADGSVFSGAGNFHVYNSILQYSKNVDVHLGNTAPFSVRDSFFLGSPAAIYSGGTGNPAPFPISGNTFVDNPVATGQAPINVANQGPILLTDNVFRPIVNGAVTLTAWENNDMVAAGNTVTTSPGALRADGRFFELDTSLVAPSAINATPPTLPGVAPNLHRPITEIAVGADTPTIQAALNAAAPQNGVVHLPEGQYSVTATLTVPAGVSLVCDGMFATSLNWAGAAGVPGPVLKFIGPGRMDARECRINAGLAVDAIGTSNIDQPGSRVFMHGVQMGADNLANNANLFVDSVQNVRVEMEDIAQSGTTGTGIKVAAGKGAQVIMWDGTSCCETLPYQVLSGSLLLRDTWNEQPGPALLQVSGASNVTVDGARSALSSTGQSTPAISVSGLNGTVAILAAEPSDRLIISGDGSAAQVLESSGDAYCPVVDPYFIDQSAPAAVWGLLLNRECTTTTPGSGSIPTTNIGSSDPTFVRAALAQTRAAHQVPLAPVPSGATDLRLYRVMLSRGVNNIHVQ